MAICIVTWEELLDDYRSLGGIAENVRLDSGPFGRGIFVNDPNEPARLFTPENLNVPSESIVIRNGQMTTTSETLGARERAFFENYQRYFGWGAGGCEESYELQAAWHALPTEIVEALKAISTDGSEQRLRFAAPDEQIARNVYLAARVFSYKQGSYIVPMIDLINHSSTSAQYGFENGVSVSGTFADEMLVSYNSADSWAQMMTYGFAHKSPLAYSLGINIGLPQGRSIAVARSVSITVSDNRLKFPMQETKGNQTQISFLLLGYTAATDLPRAVFRKLANFMETAEADRVFDGIQAYNHTTFIDLMRKLRKYDGPLIRTMEEAVLNQLEVLSACIGARTL